MEEQPSSPLSQVEYLETELTKLLTKMDPEMPKLSEQCIYKVPQKFHQVNPKAYTPSAVSIGPFHKPYGSNGENNTLKFMEDVKLKYLEKFLNRNKQLSKKDLFLSLVKKERRIRSCYAVPIYCSSNDFLMMIVVDACFIIEHFLRIYTGLDWTEGEPLSPPWLLADIIQDLTLLENQLPFFVLEDIFNSVRDGMHIEFPYENVESSFFGPVRDANSFSFLDITFFYFREFNERLSIAPFEIIEKPKHFTDLLRTFMQPLPFPHKSQNLFSTKHLQSASKLSEAGMVFKVGSKEKGCLFDIKYDRFKKVMEMPCLIVDDNTERLFRNILTFEQCHCPDSPHVTQYLIFLDFLINTDKDVDVLIDKKIILNWMGNANVEAKMFNSLCANISVPFVSEEYYSIFSDLIEFYENLFTKCNIKYNKYMTIFHRDYFDTPWKKASTIAAVILLVCTVTQTICSLISLPLR